MDIRIDDLSVYVGIPAGRPPECWETVLSWGETTRVCQKIGLPLVPGFTKGCAIVTHARDIVLHEFLESPCNRLFCIDSDMEWLPDHFLRLVALSQVVDVVGAVYPAKRDTPTFFVNLADRKEVECDEYGLMEVDGIGMGFTIINRKVIEELVATKPTMLDQMTGKTMAKVFRTDIHQGNFRGEDMCFFADLKELGYRVHIDPSIDLAHHGQKRYTGRFMDAFQVNAPPDRHNDAPQLALTE